MSMLLGFIQRAGFASMKTPIVQLGKTKGVRSVVISGPSGSGKSTLIHRLLQDYSNCFSLCVSHTTRKVRAGETDGKHYYFVSRSQFEEAIKRSEFIEYAEFSGNLYGTSKMAITQVSESGRICVLDLDMQGVKSMKKTSFNPLYIFIKPPDIDTIKKRLLQRGTETEESISKRLASAVSAMEHAEQSGTYDHIIDNVHIDDAYNALEKIIKPEISAVLKNLQSEGKS